ncbi:hypothetical protein JCM10449v2_007498 [Rhodotorula kratochvilovae]
MEWQMDPGSPLTSLASSSGRSSASPRPASPSPAPPPPSLAAKQSLATSEHAEVLDLRHSSTAADHDHRKCEADDVEMSTVEAKPDQHGETEDRKMSTELYGELREEGEIDRAAEVNYKDEEDKIVLVAPTNKGKQDERISPDSPPSHERGTSPSLPPTSDSPLLRYDRRRSSLPPQDLAWQPSGRSETSASPTPDARVSPPDPPLTPRSHATASRFNPSRFAYVHRDPPPPHVAVWQYSFTLPFREMGGRLIGKGGQVALDIRERAGACEFHVLFREDDIVHIVITGSRPSIMRALQLVRSIAYSPDSSRCWTRFDQYTLEHTDPRWCEFDEQYMEPYHGFWLRDEYIERDEFDYRWAKYGDVRGDTLLLDRGDRYAPTPDAAHNGPPVNRHQTPDAPQGPPARFADQLEPRYARDEGKKRKRDRSRSPSRSRARSSRPSEKSRVAVEETTSSYTIPIPVSAIPLFVGAGATTHFIKQTTGVDIKLVSDAINAELVLQPAVGSRADGRSLDEARSFVVKVLTSSGVATSGSSREKEKERGAPRTRREASPRTPASYSPLSPRSVEEGTAYRAAYERERPPRGADRDRSGARERDELRERAQASRRHEGIETGRSRRDEERESGKRDSGWSGWSEPKWDRRGERRREERYEGEDAGRGREKETRRSSPDRHHRSRERPRFRSRSPRRGERDERTNRGARTDRDDRGGYHYSAMSAYEPRYADPTQRGAFVSQGYPPSRTASSHSHEFDVGGGPVYIQEQRRLVLRQRASRDGRAPKREWDRETMWARAEGTAKEASPGWGQRGAPWHQTWSARRKPAERAAGARGGE